MSVTMKTIESKTQKLSIEKILKAPKSEYMNAGQLNFFRSELLDLYHSTQARVQDIQKQMSNPINDSDINDRASLEEQSNLALRIIDREIKLLPKIQQSLKRIRLGTYGYCLESGEPIGIPRLLARPTAEYCAEEKVLIETKEQQYKT